jgi:hypothetical protein
MPTSIGSIPPGTGNGNGSVSGGVTPLGEPPSLSIVFILFIIIGGFSIERELSECTRYAISALPSSKYARTTNLWTLWATWAVKGWELRREVGNGNSKGRVPFVIGELSSFWIRNPFLRSGFLFSSSLEVMCGMCHRNADAYISLDV